MRIDRSLRFYPVARQVPVHQEREAGFSLIELMVVIGIMAIITAIALPAYSSWRERTAARSASDALIAHMKQARIMAISESRCVEVLLNTGTPSYTLDVTGPKALLIPLSQYSKNLTMTTSPANLVGFVFKSDGTAGTGTCAVFSAANGSVTIASSAGTSFKITMSNTGQVHF